MICNALSSNLYALSLAIRHGSRSEDHLCNKILKKFKFSISENKKVGLSVTFVVDKIKQIAFPEKERRISGPKITYFSFFSLPNSGDWHKKEEKSMSK